ncbi:hypothetical protein Dsin_018730, partial [Dipteronia sinensis]
ACHNWIPTKFNLARRGILTDGSCPLCRNHEETTIHALWGCQKLLRARNDWLAINPGIRGNYNNFFDFIFDCYLRLRSEELGLLCIIIWRVLFMRNSYVHNGKSQDLSKVFVWSKNFHSNYKFTASPTSCNLVSPTQCATSWRPPDPNVFKINSMAITDVKACKIGIGIVIRDHTCSVLASRCQYLNASYNRVTANAMAILKGLHFGIACCGESPVCVESEATTVVKWINDASHLASDCGVILTDIATILNRLGISSVLPGSSRTNKVALGLAKKALTQKKDFTWMNDFPRCVSGEIEADRN